MTGNSIRNLFVVGLQSTVPPQRRGQGEARDSGYDSDAPICPLFEDE